MKTLLKNLFIFGYMFIGVVGLTSLAIQSYIVGGICMALFLIIGLYVMWACK